MTDGLSSLKGRVGRRDVPPPRHAAPAKTIDPQADTAAPPPVAPPETKPAARQPAKARAATSELIRQTVYLDDAADDVLEEVRSASRRRRVDANRSAVIRLALRRLKDDLSAEQIVDEIERASKHADTSKPGRRLI